MKNLFRYLSFSLLAILALSSCNKNDIDYDKLAEEQRIRDSIEHARITKLIEEQAPLLQAYAEEHFDNPILSDSTGIWYEILEPGEENSYTYSLQVYGNSLGYVPPTITVIYKGELMGGEVFDKTDTEEHPGGDTFSSSSWNSFIPAWFYAFFPKSMSYDGRSIKTGGLTTMGLMKGSKIRFITPSPYGYDATEKKAGDVTIPKNSPLVFEIEVLDIK